PPGRRVPAASYRRPRERSPQLAGTGDENGPQRTIHGEPSRALTFPRAGSYRPARDDPTLAPIRSQACDLSLARDSLTQAPSASAGMSPRWRLGLVSPRGSAAIGGAEVLVQQADPRLAHGVAAEVER